MNGRKPMTISKVIPARTETLTARWCTKQFFEMSERYREIRKHNKSKGNKCFWCKHYFENGEMMALASFESKGNRLLCQTCADELIQGEQA